MRQEGCQPFSGESRAFYSSLFPTPLYPRAESRKIAKFFIKYRWGGVLLRNSDEPFQTMLNDALPVKTRLQTHENTGDDCHQTVKFSFLQSKIDVF